MAHVSYIDLLRHGETQNSGRFNGSTDHPLTEHGWAQMQASVEKTTLSWQHIFTSPLIRCARFAQFTAKHHAIPCTQDERFSEIYFGDWEGMSSAELMHTDADALSRFWRNPLENPPPQGEHLLDFKARVLSAWADMHTHFAGKNLLLIAHGGVIRVLLCHTQQHPVERLMEIDVAYGSIHRIQMTHHNNMPPVQQIL